MPKDDLKTIRAGAPWGGLNEAADARVIGNNELAAASNVVVRDGKICPRPGYEELHLDPLGLAFRRHYSTAIEAINALAIDTTNGAIYWTDTGNGEIHKLVLATGAESKIVTSLTTPYGIALDVANNKVYFTDGSSGGSVRSCALDGSSVTNVYTSQGSVRGIAVDTVNSKLYWAISGGRISVAPFTPGAASEHISSGNAGTLTDAHQIKVDATNSHLYWISGTTTTTVKRASLTTANTSVTTLETISSGAAVYGLALNVTGDKLFRPNSVTSIYQSALDGSGDAPVMVSQSDATLRYGYEYHSGQSRLYFIQYNSANTSYSICSVSAIPETSYPVATEWFRRSILGVTASSQFCSDIVFSQAVNTANSTSEMAILFPTLSIQKTIQMGYHFGSSTAGDPTIWAMNDRDNNPTYFSPFSSSAAACNFAWTGTGINDAKGGWLVAQKGVGARVLNYVLSDAIYTVTWADAGGGDTGTWQFVFDGVRSTGGLVADGSSTAAQVRADLLTIPAINGVHVTKSGSVWTIRIHGVWSGKDPPALTTNRSGGSNFTVTVAKVQTGGLDTSGGSSYVGAMVYCRPAGMPRPKTGIGAASSGLRNITADNTSGTVVGSGIFSFRVTFYSSRFDQESPPSNEFGDDDLTYPLLQISGSSICRFTWDFIPSTLYFDSTAPFRHIDKMRIYARKWGVSQSGGVITDSTGAWDDWYLIQQVDIGQSSTGTLFDWDGDPSDKTGTKLPVENEYPPANAALVTLHDDRAIYNSGDNFVWVSELQKFGGVADQELGYEYVSNESFNKLNRQIKNDFPITALKSHAGRLFLGTAERMISIDMSTFTTNGTIFVDPMEGTSGVANQNAIVETSPLPDLPGFLLWLSPYGHIYAFNGASSQRLTLNLNTTVDDMVKKFWVDDTYFESGLKTLHYASMAIDPIEQRILLSSWDTSGNAMTLCYCVADKAWTKWTLGGYGLTSGRLWSGTDKGKDVVVFGLAGGKLWKMMDGYADAVTSVSTSGSSFAWSFSTKKLSPTAGFYKTKWGLLGVAFSTRNFSSTDAAFSLTPVIGKGSLTAQSETSIQKDVAAVSVSSRSRWVQLQMGGTHTHLMDHAECVAVVAEYDPTVTGSLKETDNDPTS